MSEDYTDSERLDEMLTAEDYNRFEEQQVFLDREGYDDLCLACGMYNGHEDWCEAEDRAPTGIGDYDEED